MFIHASTVWIRLQIQQQQQQEDIKGNHRKRNGRNYITTCTIFESVSAGKSRNGWRDDVLPIYLLRSSQILLPTGFHHNALHGSTQVASSKGTQTICRAIEWNDELESSVWSERPPENSAKHDKKDNSRILPRNLYTADSPLVQPPEFTVLREVAARC